MSSAPSIQVKQGDITLQHTEAIVNAANSSLMGGGGVDAAIHQAGGPAILEACKIIREQQGPCATGQAVITTAGNLSATYVIHTVGPVWEGGKANEAELLAACYRNSLQLAADHGIRSIAFPNISTGSFGYPKAQAAVIAVDTVRSWLLNHRGMQVIFVCFDAENKFLYDKLLS